MKIVFVTLALLIAFPAAAEIRRADMNRKIVVSEGHQLLNQVDIVSLYLSSERVAYEPLFAPDQKIKVEVTVLSRHFIENRELMRDFVSRQIAIFGRELSKRLHSAAPTIALHFNPGEDLIFEINCGPQRSRVATVSGGSWVWVAPSSPAPILKKTGKATEVEEESRPSKGLSEARSFDVGESCDCPALIRKK